MMTLWDLLPKRVREKFFGPITPSPTIKPPAAFKAAARGKLAPSRTVHRDAPSTRFKEPTSPSTTPASMQAKYDAVVATMLAAHGVRVRKWRTSMSGVAWQVTYRDGSIKKLIESPRPKGPMSVAVFLHEIGHHAIGFNVYKPRCLEEYHAWAFSIQQMEAHGLNVTDAVRRRMARSLHYAVGKAARRGIKSIPVELVPYIERPK